MSFKITLSTPVSFPWLAHVLHYASLRSQVHPGPICAAQQVPKNLPETQGKRPVRRRRSGLARRNGPFRRASGSPTSPPTPSLGEKMKERTESKLQLPSLGLFYPPHSESTRLQRGVCFPQDSTLNVKIEACLKLRTTTAQKRARSNAH